MEGLCNALIKVVEEEYEFRHTLKELEVLQQNNKKRLLMEKDLERRQERMRVIEENE